MKGNSVWLFLLAAAITISSCSQLEGLGGLIPGTETPPPPDAPLDVPPDGPSALDFGDAPDPSFPSLFASDGARAVPGVFWLGQLAFPPTSEIDANVVDQDQLDDGLIQLLVTPGRVLVSFQAVLAESSEARRLFFNLLADVNRDGQWQAFQGAAGPIQEWAVANRELLLNPGEEQEIATEFPFLQPGAELWFRVTLTDQPVEGVDWDATGLFDEGEVEDYKLPSGPGADWSFACEPESLELYHGELGEIGFIQISGDGGPDSFGVVKKSGKEGASTDPAAVEIAVSPPLDPFAAPSEFPDVVTVESLEAYVHGPPHTDTYTTRVLLIGEGRWQLLDCEVKVRHWDSWPPVVVDSDSVVYNGPPQVRSGGTLRARFCVTDANGNPAQGEFFATLGDPPGDPRASHASGQLDAEGWITLELPVNWPPGLTVLYFSWRGQVFEIAQIEVLP